MKKLIFLIGFISLSLLGFSQANKGLNFGVGANNRGLPVYASYDIPVYPSFALAPQVQFGLGGGDFLILGVKGDYYFDEMFAIPENFDVYGGANLGFLMYFGNDNTKSSGLWLGLEIGGRWFWNEKWGLNVEFAGGVGYSTKFGVTMKM